MDADSRTLSGILSNVGKAHATRATLPVLEYVAFHGALKAAYCTDLEKTVLHDMPGLDFSCCAPWRLLNDLVANATGEVSLTLGDGGKLIVEFAGHRSKLNTMPVSEMPIVSQMTDDWKRVDVQPFLSHVASVAIAAATDESRPVLAGVFVDEALGLTAADGFRLATTGFSGKGVIVPAATMALLPGLFANAPEVRYQFDTTRAAFWAGDVMVFTQLIDGNFPNANQIIPARSEHLIEFIASDALRALKTVLLMADPKVPFVTVERNADGVRLYAESDSGQATGEFAASGDSFEPFGISGRLLREALSTMGTVTMGLTTPHRPVLLTEGDLRHVIMPMSVRGEK